MPRTDSIAIVENAVWACLRQFPALRTVGAAVSGGPDSLCMLSALHELSKIHGFSVRVLTINHNMRPAEQSKADCDAVAEFCAGLSVFCSTASLEPGEIKACAARRGRGEEEAARYLRYRLFSSFITEHNPDAFCTGHNADDQLETLLQRFLQGSSSYSGIASRRGIIVRPLLTVPRAEILRYVREKALPARTDETNFNTDYFRNRIRNILVPVLDRDFQGWRTGVTNGAKKRAEDTSFIARSLSGICWKLADPDCAELSQVEFDCLPAALQRRLLFQALELLGCKIRIPFRFFRPFMQNGSAVSGYGCEICRFNGKILIKKVKNYRNPSDFFVIMEELGSIRVAGISADISMGRKSNAPEGSAVAGPFELPFIIRSPAPCDLIKTGIDSYRSLASILGGWKIPAGERRRIPVVERDGEILCVCGETAGKKNWYAAGMPLSAEKAAYIYFNRGTYV